jgi:hypothetical protein
MERETMAKAPKDDITTTDPQVDTPVVTDPIPPAPDATAQDAATDVATDAPDLSGPAPTPDAAGADNPDPTPAELQALENAIKDDMAQKLALDMGQTVGSVRGLLAQAAEAPAVDVERLQLLIGQIDWLNHTGHRMGLIDELVDVYGMEHQWNDGSVTISMAGIDIDPAPDMETALTNWANAARRAVMQAAA